MVKKPTILLVEDEAPKRDHIVRLLHELNPRLAIVTARSVNSALDVVETTEVDLMLLDMSLPTFDAGDRESGGRPQGFGGAEILRMMQMAELSCPVVIITGYEGFAKDGGLTVDLDQLRREWIAEFEGIVSSVLHYNSTYDEWKTTLSSTLQKLGLRED
ncbi:response regulator [Agrobacterium rosae]|uniref:Response regulator n=1 Tax=Agrobacterium rosae TaxID=1972867 RepID=A0AAW9FPC3_9HYPH|nr:response regulator [Agrobacterium rosae]MDX8304653.1 response regulator [Agrobacterium rosae]